MNTATITTKILDPKVSDTLNSCGGNFGVMSNYCVGNYPPHYRVPAIRYAVTIDHEFIAVWGVGKGLAYYHDDYETVFAY